MKLSFLLLNVMFALVSCGGVVHKYVFDYELNDSESERRNSAKAESFIVNCFTVLIVVVVVVFIMIVFLI